MPEMIDRNITHTLGIHGLGHRGVCAPMLGSIGDCSAHRQKRKERVAENINSSDPVNPVPEVFGIYVLFAFSPIK
jgi:hypothetical protein